jgi:hypothetical protein
MHIVSKLPYELLIHIYEYNPEHREKMNWVLQDIRNINYCYVCNKVIIKYIYSMRRSDITCCSLNCVQLL